MRGQVKQLAEYLSGPGFDPVQCAESLWRDFDQFTRHQYLEVRKSPSTLGRLITDTVARQSRAFALEICLYRFLHHQLLIDTADRLLSHIVTRARVK